MRTSGSINTSERAGRPCRSCVCDTHNSATSGCIFNESEGHDGFVRANLDLASRFGVLVAVAMLAFAAPKTAKKLDPSATRQKLWAIRFDQVLKESPGWT